MKTTRYANRVESAATETARQVGMIYDTGRRRAWQGKRFSQACARLYRANGDHRLALIVLGKLR